MAAVGYGLEIAERTVASLVGIDFSVEALRQAGAQAQRRGMAATFKVGDLTATGLDRPDRYVRLSAIECFCCWVLAPNCLAEGPDRPLAAFPSTIVDVCSSAHHPPAGRR